MILYNLLLSLPMLKHLLLLLLLYTPLLLLLLRLLLLNNTLSLACIGIHKLSLLCLLLRLRLANLVSPRLCFRWVS